MSPGEAYALALKIGPSKELEEIICKDVGASYYYAKHVLKGSFSAGEDAIAKHPMYSSIYAWDVVRGPFPAGEAMIAKDPSRSYRYAAEVLKGPFPAGEAAISRHPEFSYLYAINVLKSPFPAGEKKLYPGSAIYYSLRGPEYQFRFDRQVCLPEQIARLPGYALAYAIMKNGRFPLGEPAMKKSPRIWERYQKFLQTNQPKSP